MFENAERQTDDGACLYCKLIYEPKDSGELKSGFSLYIKSRGTIFNPIMYRGEEIRPLFRWSFRFCIANWPKNTYLPHILKQHSTV